MTNNMYHRVNPQRKGAYIASTYKPIINNMSTRSLILDFTYKNIK